MLICVLFLLELDVSDNLDTVEIQLKLKERFQTHICRYSLRKSEGSSKNFVANPCIPHIVMYIYALLVSQSRC